MKSQSSVIKLLKGEKKKERGKQWKVVKGKRAKRKEREKELVIECHGKMQQRKKGIENMDKRKGNHGRRQQ